MSDGWTSAAIGSLIQTTFSGCWGDDPRPGHTSTIVLRATDIDDEGHVNLESGAHRHISGRELFAKRLLPGDILLEASGGGPGKPVGRPALYEGGSGQEYVTSNFFKVLRPNPAHVNGRFLAWKLLHLSKLPDIWQFQQQTTGIINLKFSDYLAYELALPTDLEEQARIAQVLDAVDNEIRRTDAIVSKIRLARSGYLLQTLPATDDRAAGWTWSPLSEIVDIGSGSTPSRSRADYWTRGTVSWVKTGEVAMGRIASTEEQITMAAVADLGLRRYPTGTILLAMYGQGATRGRVARLEIEACINQACAALQVHPAEVDAGYLFHILQAKYQELRGLAQGSQQSNLSAALIGTFEVPLPPTIKVQGQIAECLQAFEDRITLEEARRHKLVGIKEGLTADLLSGRVGVPAEATS